MAFNHEKGRRWLHYRLSDRSANSAKYRSKLSHPNRQALLNVLFYGTPDLNTRPELTTFDPAPMNIERPKIHPYLDYLAQNLETLSNSWDYSQDVSVQFFIEVVHYFSVNPQSLVYQFISAKYVELRGLLLRELKEKEKAREVPSIGESLDWVTDRVMETVSCIALWTMNGEFGAAFADRSKRIDLCRKLNLSEQQFELGTFKVRDFAEFARVLPKVDSWVPKGNPNEEITTKRLNAKLLQRIARTKVQWTFDVSKHLTFSDDLVTRTVAVYCMPCRFNIGEGVWANSKPQQALREMGFTGEGNFGEEIQRSYHLFFGPRCSNLLNDLRKSDEFLEPEDPELKYLSLNTTSEKKAWVKEDFPHLWPRLKDLEQYVADIKPDSFIKLLWRDRRDHYGWYTFIFAFVVLILTVASLGISTGQLYKAIYPSNPPATNTSTSAAEIAAAPPILTVVAPVRTVTVEAPATSVVTQYLTIAIQEDYLTYTILSAAGTTATTIIVPYFTETLDSSLSTSNSGSSIQTPTATSASPTGTLAPSHGSNSRLSLGLGLGLGLGLPFASLSLALATRAWLHSKKGSSGVTQPVESSVQKEPPSSSTLQPYPGSPASSQYPAASQYPVAARYPPAPQYPAASSTSASSTAGATMKK